MPRYLNFSTHLIRSFPSNISVMKTFLPVPTFMQNDLSLLKVIPLTEANDEHRLSNVCNPETVGERIKISSAYKMHAKHLFPTQQPYPLDCRLSTSSSKYKLNRIGDRTPPCLTPASTLNDLLEQPFHRTHEYNFSYQLSKHLTQHIGTERLSNLLKRVTCAKRSNALLASNVAI
jgi:hypothetical protein